ncbi:MAG: hypothetical protein HUK24_05430, partial [Sphaerochaetaceae bacterium]|nr:hypothetical protein [Sphaerochaetaceae bacterium]
MKKRNTGLLIFFFSLFFVLLLAFLIWFFFFEPVNLITDDMWYSSIPLKERILTYGNLSLKGKRFKVYTLEGQTLSSKDDLERFFSSVNSGPIVLSPFIASVTSMYDIRVKDLLKTTVVSIGIDNGNCFTYTTKSDLLSGWIEAGTKALGSGTIGIIYDESTANILEALKKQVGSSNIKSYKKEGLTKTFISTTLEDMDKIGVALAFCLHTDNFGDFFQNGETSVMWVYDFRYSNTVPKNSTYGIVYPKLSKLDDILSKSDMLLPYGFCEIHV